jgi:hypothetical protein
MKYASIYGTSKKGIVVIHNGNEALGEKVYFPSIKEARAFVKVRGLTRWN